jgi:hypothetical protein
MRADFSLFVFGHNLQAAFFHGCNGGGSKLGAGGGSSGSKYQSARYNKTPGNAALKSVPKTQTTRSREDGSSKCLANPPQTPAIWWSSCERHSFMVVIQLFYRHPFANRKRQRAGALQDATAQFISHKQSLCVLDCGGPPPLSATDPGDSTIIV